MSSSFGVPCVSPSVRRSSNIPTESGKQWPTDVTRVSLPHPAASFPQSRYHLSRQRRRKRKKVRSSGWERASEPQLPSCSFGTGDFVPPKSSICCFDRINKAKVQQGLGASFSTRPTTMLSESSSFDLYISSQGRRHLRCVDETPSHPNVLQPELSAWACSVSSIGYEASEGEETAYFGPSSSTRSSFLYSDSDVGFSRPSSCSTKRRAATVRFAVEVNLLRKLVRGNLTQQPTRPRH